MFDYFLSVEALTVALVVFGVAPGLVLRLIVLAFHPEDPCRDELRGELYGVPRWERPLWVAEQLEIAISEGLWGRLVWAATGHLIYRWHLRSGTKAHESHPETFWIPSEQEKDEIEPGFRVKLMFDLKGGGERMWVEVDAVKQGRFVGTLWNHPAFIPKLNAGDKIKFQRHHIIDVLPPDDARARAESEQAKVAGICNCCGRPASADEGECD